MIKTPKISRRTFTASAGLAAVGPALAQTARPTPPQDDARQASAAAESRRRAITQFEIPIETEPAFIFKA